MLIYGNIDKPKFVYKLVKGKNIKYWIFYTLNNIKGSVFDIKYKCILKRWNKLKEKYKLSIRNIEIPESAVLNYYDNRFNIYLLDNQGNPKGKLVPRVRAIYYEVEEMKGYHAGEYA